MLGAGYNFEGTMALSGAGASPTISARNMLSIGAFTYWLQGPIVTAVIIEDRANRSYDVNTDGGAGNLLHPICEAWFYPQNNSVEVDFALENTWASHIAANGARSKFRADLEHGRIESGCATDATDLHAVWLHPLAPRLLD